MKLGYLKDETGGKRIVEMFCLRSKMYYLAMEDSQDKMAAKGLHRSTFFTQVMRENYRNEIIERAGKGHHVQFHRFINDRKQNISTAKQVKRGLSGFDDKRWIARDNIHTFPYGFKGNKSKLVIG